MECTFVLPERIRSEEAQVSELDSTVRIQAVARAVVNGP